MKKLNKILVSITILSIVFLTMFSYAKVDLEQAYSDGARWGAETGKVYGYKDFVNEKDSDWYDAYLSVFPTNNDLIEFFNLETKDDDDDDYNREFIRGYRNSFLDGYNAGYANIVEETDDDEETSPSAIAGELHGKYFAELDAAQVAIQDYHEGKYNDWTLSYPTEVATKIKYDLYKDSDLYINAFMESYKENFELAYKENYRDTNIELSTAPEENGNLQGNTMGSLKGEADGMLDVIRNNRSNWQSAYNEMISGNDLFTRYNLYRENKEYIDSFEGAFKTAYEIAYQRMYQETNIEIETRNVNYRKVDSNEKIVGYSQYVLNIDGGSKSLESTIPFFIEIDVGTIYSSETYFGISENQLPVSNLNGKLKASGVYDIKVINSDLSVKLQKPIKLSFNFYGSSKAGIYKFVNKQWMYLQTEFDDGVIYTEIPAVDFNGGKFAILIDNEYRPLQDSMLHWAYDDLKVYLKRGYISNETDFNPDSYMTRKEFSRMIRRNTDGMIDYSYSSPIDFVDKDLFLEYQNDINFMVTKGYMNGVSSDLFNPNGYITYNQVEIVMNRIMNEEFSWNDISELMLTERFNKSKVNDFKSNYIDKAEVIFMLNKVLGSEVLFEK